MDFELEKYQKEMAAVMNSELIYVLKLFLFVAAFAFQGCSPGETYSSSKNLLNQSGSSSGDSGSVNPNPSANPINPVNGPSCSWQWADDFAPVTPMNLRPSLKSMSCTQANIGQKQNVIDNSADWTCICQIPTATSPTPTPAPGASPTPAPTPPPPPPASGVDLCPSIPVHYDLNASSQYVRMASGNYAYMDVNISLSSGSAPVMTPGAQMIIRLNIAASDSTTGKFAAAFDFVDVGPSRGGRFVTISKTKCDYSASAIWLSPNPFLTDRFLSGVNGGSTTFLINETMPVAPGSNDLKIETGTWYINIKNVPTGCPAGISCDVISEWHN